jgi:hypothetical protein
MFTFVIWVSFSYGGDTQLIIAADSQSELENILEIEYPSIDEFDVLEVH